MQRDFERLVGSEQHVVHVQVARSASNCFQKTIELVLIGRFQTARFCELIAQSLQPFEQRGIDEREVLLGGINDVQQDDIVTTMSEVFEAQQQ